MTEWLSGGGREYTFGCIVGNWDTASLDIFALGGRWDPAELNALWEGITEFQGCFRHFDLCVCVCVWLCVVVCGCLIVDYRMYIEFVLRKMRIEKEGSNKIYIKILPNTSNLNLISHPCSELLDIHSPS